MRNKILPIIIAIAMFSFLLLNVTLVEAFDLDDNLSKNEKIEIIQKEIERLLLIVSKIYSREQLQKKISAESYFVMDISNDKTLLKKNYNYFYSIASITKLMSAIVTLENIDLQEEIILTNNMLRPQEIPLLSIYGQSPSIFTGLKISAENLLKASLIQSTTAANQALTHFLKEGEFIKLMNEKARELKMESTVFYDSHGLNSFNRSSASEIANLLKYIYEEHPQILEITKNDDFWLPDPSGRFLKFKNLNNFHDNPKFIGGKTGYLTVSRQTLASVFNVKEKPTTIVLLRSENRQSDVLKIIDWLEKF